MVKRRGSFRLYLVLWILLLSGEPRREVAAGDAAPVPSRVLVLESLPPEPAAREGTTANWLERAKLFEVRRAGGGAVDGGLLAWANVVVVAGGGMEGGEKSAAPLLEAVRAGKGLVVSGEAAWCLPCSRVYSLLLGREPASGEPPAAEESTRPLDLAVAVRDQSHPVTQCITHFRHRGVLGKVKLALAATLLAAGVVEAAPGAAGGEKGGAERSAPAPLVWSMEHGAGRVLVSALDPGEGPSAGAARTILARAVQWAARRQVTAPLEGEMALASDLPPERGFFMGREIAPVMSYHGADWLVRPDREETEQPEKVLDSLELKPGMTVVDLGAGVGYFTLRLARRVGPEGKVLGVEVQEEMLRGLKERAAKEGVENVVPILATEKDPRLSEDTADLVLMVDVYHELAHPREVMAAVRKALRSKGRVVLVEYRGEDPTVPIKPLHRTTLPQMRAELEALGFRWLEVKESLPHQRVIIAGKR